MAPAAPQQRDSSMVTLLLTVGVGRMLLKCLFLLRRAILYCRERGVVAAPAWTGWLCRDIPWQPEPARLHPVMGAIPPSPLGSQGCTPSSRPSSKTTHGAGLDTSPSRAMHYTGSQVPKQQQQDKVQAARSPQGHVLVPAAWPGRLMVPFPSTNCLSTTLGGAGGCVLQESCGVKPGIIR